MKKILESFFKKYDFKARIVPIGRLKDLAKDYNTVMDKGLIDKKVYKSYLEWFEFEEPEEMSENSIIILATRRPMHRLWLNHKKKSIGIIIPPTYINYRKTNREIFKLLKKLLNSKGCNISTARLPLKLLAARSGLAKYGRNNIAYIKKWGSFHQLAGFYADCRADSDPWQDMKSLDACRTCTLCMENCPTGAIRNDRFILDAGKCLTFFNESKDSIPEWVLPESHNSLIGCMECQLICPYNKSVRGEIEDIGEFDSEETEMLLKGLKRKNKDKRFMKKLKDSGIMDEYMDVLPRNLDLLVRDL